MRSSDPSLSHVPPTLLGLVQRYSPTGQAGEAVDWLVARMAALGFGESFVDAAGNAVGVMGSGPRQMVLLGHIDTVPGKIAVRVEVGASPPRSSSAASRSGAPDERGMGEDNPGAHLVFPPNPEDADFQLYGRGTVDAKGALAAFVDAVAAVGARPGVQFVVIGAVDEEGASRGARYVAEHYRPACAIVGEPSGWERITLGYRGSLWCAYRVRRELSHTASGQESACEAAVAFWNRLKAWCDAHNAAAASGRVFDQLSPTLRAMRSESDGFAETAALRIGVRLPQALAPAALEHALEELSAGDELLIEDEPVPAYRAEKNTPLVRGFLAAMRAEGGTPGFTLKSGTSDLNVVAPVWQCPTLVYGPGDAHLDHTPHEHLSIAEYRRAVAVLGRVLSTL